VERDASREGDGDECVCWWEGMVGLLGMAGWGGWRRGGWVRRVVFEGRGGGVFQLGGNIFSRSVEQLGQVPHR